jgi:hypothetical protein
MKRLLCLLLLCGACWARSGDDLLPVRALHMWAPKPADTPLLVRFIREALPKEGINTLVLEFDYHYQVRSHPEVTDPDALSKEDVKQIVSACREARVHLIPLLGLLGHQSRGNVTFGLLRSHPEFDETPGKFPANEGIYCRSYCPLHPQIHALVFDLIDELMEVAEADAFHAGLDEVFLLGEEECPRCRGKLTAQLFADEVWRLRNHLAERGRKLWIWGDRLIDGATSGVDKWEGSVNQTWPAVDRVPRDIVICDWHYEKAEPTAAYFAVHGLAVVTCPWKTPGVGRAEVKLVRAMRAPANSELAGRMLGILQTSWQDPADLIHMYFGEMPATGRSGENLQSFREVFDEIRNGK